jgi:AcrR family transcriptional regulator
MRQSKETQISARQQRVQQLLNIAVQLVQQWGYQKTTMDDIAKQAGISKGILYLHWKSREALFETLLLREAVMLIRTLMARAEVDHAEMIPSRMLKATRFFLEERPLIKALFTDDTAMLGTLLQGTAATLFKSHKVFLTPGYLTVLRDNGLMKTDLDLHVQCHTIWALFLGFCLSSAFSIEGKQLSVDVQAGALAHAAHTLFEPTDPVPPGILLQVHPLYKQVHEDQIQHIEGFVKNLMEE